MTTKPNCIIYNTPDWLTAFSTGRDSGVEDLGLRLEELALPRQTHSDHVLWMDKAGRPADTDAVITDVPGLCVCVKTADCIPVLIYDSRCRIVAAIHAGWRGTVARIVAKTIAEMHSAPEDLHAIIGPGISLDWFEVGDEVYDRFLQEGFPMQRIAKRYETCCDAPHTLLPSPKWHIDLWDANRWVLEQAGVRDILVEGTCTRSTLNFYSARRETINTGRNMNGLFIKP